MPTEVHPGRVVRAVSAAARRARRPRYLPIAEHGLIGDLQARRARYLPIAEHRLIGDLHTVALVGMIDRHYGHLARDGREHAIRLLDELSTGERPRWTLVDAPWTPRPAAAANRDNGGSGYAGENFKPSDGLEPSTPSLPWRFRGVTCVHARSLATQFLLQIGLVRTPEMRRETPRVSFLMCPFCVRAASPD